MKTNMQMNMQMKRQGQSLRTAARRHRLRQAAVIGLAVFLVLAGALPWGNLGADEGEGKETLALALLGKVIVIDAGHGGFDPGAIGAGGVQEKEVNLAVAGRVAALLRQVGAQVVETRTEDVALADTKREDIQRRVQIAEDAGAELFITVQANSIPQPQYRGAQVFYAAGSSEGKRLSESIQQSMAAVLQNTKRKAKAIENIYVVNKLAMPSIVVETGFLSNAEEESLLADEKYQMLVAYAIFLGIVGYYAEQPVASF
ncbi:MAG: N-acetylmuramoyl-L-alanine amidase [Firmicutes bacterium]|nr:N-acetylmuramoyl-L-alanine amidase [Bacillota bacterium]